MYILIIYQHIFILSNEIFDIGFEKILAIAKIPKMI